MHVITIQGEVCSNRNVTSYSMLSLSRSLIREFWRFSNSHVELQGKHFYLQKLHIEIKSARTKEEANI